MIIHVVFKGSKEKDRQCSVGRIPCVGEFVTIGYTGLCYEVWEVVHFLDVSPKTHVLAKVSVK